MSPGVHIINHSNFFMLSFKIILKDFDQANCFKTIFSCPAFINLHNSKICRFMFIVMKENCLILDHLEALFRHCNHLLENAKSYRNGLNRYKSDGMILACLTCG